VGIGTSYPVDAREVDAAGNLSFYSETYLTYDNRAPADPNDTLSGGLGADTFRAIQFEAGIDTVTDFNKSQGDKVDLRGILKGTALDGSIVWKADGNVDAASLARLLTGLELSRTGNDVTLKVDDGALSAFSSAGFQLLLPGANVAGNLASMDLEALVNQRVFLV
jgi:Ca2+-binding RTX toxin-like protein